MRKDSRLTRFTSLTSCATRAGSAFSVFSRHLLWLVLLLGFLASASQAGPDRLGEFVQRRVGDFQLLHHPLDERYANRAAQAVVMSQSRLASQFGLGGFPGARIIIAWDTDHFESLSGGGFPHWGAALARPSENLILLKSPRWSEVDADPTGTVMHEMVHLAVGRLVGDNHLPVWLSEGIAVEESGEMRGDAPISMATALTSGTLMDLWELENLFGFSSERAQLAYLQAESAVIFFKERYGRFTLIQLLLTMGKGVPFEQAFDEVTGGGWYGFNDDWHAWAKKRFGGYLSQDIGNWIWGFVLLLAIGVWAVRKWRARQILKRWEEEERLKDPGAWEL